MSWGQRDNEPPGVRTTLSPRMEEIKALTRVTHSNRNVSRIKILEANT
jgi:hypothetical protein